MIIMESAFHFKFQYIDFNKHIDKSLMGGTSFRSFNPSIVQLDDDEYLYCVRVKPSITEPGKDGVIIPGNYEKCPNVPNIGTNYWWNRWQNCCDTTLLFVGDHRTGNLKLATLLRKTDAYPYKNFGKYTTFDFGDARLGRINGGIHMYNNNLRYIVELRVIGATVQFVNPLPNYTAPSSKDINMQIVEMTTGRINQHMVYIDWFYKDKGIKFYDNVATNGVWSINEFYIPFDKFVLDGDGSHLTGNSDDIQIFGPNYGIMPKFSFSTPHIKIMEHDTYQDMYLGVGHIKIASDLATKYQEGSNIDNFRKNLYTDMENQFGNRYIKHFGTGQPPNCFGYIYMLYFYVIYDDNNAMRISDAYLPISLDPKVSDSDNDKDYKFSLVFPMGVDRIGRDRIVVTAGYGDFYSIALEFNLEQVINLCRHDAKNTDMRSYTYNLLIAKEGKSIISDRLSQTQIAGYKNVYYDKYLKYKERYLNQHTVK